MKPLSKTTQAIIEKMVESPAITADIVREAQERRAQAAKERAIMEAERNIAYIDAQIESAVVRLRNIRASEKAAKAAIAELMKGKDEYMKTGDFSAFEV